MPRPRWSHVAVIADMAFVGLCYWAGTQYNDDGANAWWVMWGGFVGLPVGLVLLVWLLFLTVAEALEDWRRSRRR